MSVDPAYLQVAIDIVLRAGEIQVRNIGKNLQIEKKGPIDLVTQVDVEIEKMCRKRLADHFPAHVVLAEELPNSPPATDGSASHVWMFDPIDGTVNYAHGMPVFCSSLALEIEGEIVVGAVYDPSRQELFVAERGDGARLNGRPICVSKVPRIQDAMLCTGFPYDLHETFDQLVRVFGGFVQRAQAIRRLGSAAIDLCYVASGRLDGFWEQRLKPWDTAAATLIVKEAGGVVTDMQGDIYRPTRDSVLASNGALHKEMLSILRECS